MQKYSLSVAVFDFVPVLLAASALLILASGIRVWNKNLGVVAVIGALLVTAGGACKATWKLLVATQGQDYALLETLLFTFMAPGFVGLAFAFHFARQLWKDGTPAPLHDYAPLQIFSLLAVALVPAGYLAATFEETRYWFFWLLGVTTVANLTLLVQLILSARTHQLGNSVLVAFVVSLVATFAMSGLSRLPDTEMTAWIQELTNTLAQIALLYGALQISKAMKGKAST